MTDPEPWAVVMDLQETVILCVCESWLPPRTEEKPGFDGGDIVFLFIFKLGLNHYFKSIQSNCFLMHAMKIENPGYNL